MRSKPASVLNSFFISTTLVAAIFGSASAFAQRVSDGSTNPAKKIEDVETPTDKFTEAAQEATAKAQETDRLSKHYRAEKPFTFGLNFAPVDMWVPMKWGANASYNWSPTSSWELEYLKGSISRSVFSIDIGKIEDQRVSLMYRTFSERNSFNFIWGVYYEQFKAKLGDEFLNTISGTSAASVDLMEVTTVGVTWGMGNRWYTQSGFTFGVDWLTINIPVMTDAKEGFTQYTTDQGKKDDIEDAMDFFENIPALGILKLQAGYSF